MQRIAVRPQLLPDLREQSPCSLPVALLARLHCMRDTGHRLVLAGHGQLQDAAMTNGSMPPPTDKGLPTARDSLTCGVGVAFDPRGVRVDQRLPLSR